MKEIELIPITQRNKDGALYQRSPEVESQIREALTLDRKRLFARANQKDYGADDYFQPESLVYLIRAFRIAGEVEHADKLMIALIDRCKKKIDTILRRLLSQRYIDECFEEAVGEIIGQIYDINSDKSNFAETKFWLWLEGRVCNVRRKYFKFQEEDSKADAVDNYEEKIGDSRINISKAFERKDGLAKAASLLTDRERQIYVMRYDWKWQVFSEDPEVKTISKYFGVSARMIQKWFEKAEAKLQNGNKG
jgi:RNA polymerase sigma factor (sigma-70 family)